jgi:DNA ligase-1
MTKNKPFPTLYSRTSTGAIQQWTIEVEGNKFRTVSGQVDGAKVTSSWSICEGKNIGKANETTPGDQAYLEAESKLDKKKRTGYTPDKKAIDTCVTYTEPMLAKSFDKVDFEYPVYSQPKLDGMRCIVRADGMWSRTGKKIVSSPHIFEALKPLFDIDDTLIFDGELFANKLKNDFNQIMSLAKQMKPTPADLAASKAHLEYWVYDLPSSNSDFGDRSKELKALLPKKDCLVLVPTAFVKDKEELDAAYSEYLTDGQEGQIIRVDGPYENKRSKYLIKRKEFLDDEFKILDITEGKGNRSGMFGRALCVTKKGVEFEANARGNQEYYTELLKNKKKYIGQMATIRYQNMTPDGKPRFGVMITVRDYE